LREDLEHKGVCSEPHDLMGGLSFCLLSDSFTSFKATVKIGVVSRIAMDKLPQKYKCAPSQEGVEWAQKFWKGKDKVVERIIQCLSEQKIKNTKGKNLFVLY